MKKYTGYLLFMSFCFLLFLSCQKELNFGEEVSAGSLQSNITGDCLPKIIAGTYTAGKDLGDTNYIEVNVNVTSPGSYSIITNTVNGYSFKGTGNFSAAGSNSVKLAGSGKPLVTGTDDFTVMYDSSSCIIQINVLSAGGVVVNSPAVFTLQGAPATCAPITISGAYVKNRSLDPGDSVTVGIMVTSPGTYSISTNTVNGYSFSGSGVLTTTGTQIVSLTASGIPADVGTNLFNLSVGASSCTFSILVTTPVTVTSDDYFPLTNKSYWTYDDLFHPGDTTKKQVTDTARVNGDLYQVMKEYGMYGDTLQHLYLKTGVDYFEYGSVDKYTTVLSYFPSVIDKMPFLKENLVTGASWKTSEFTGNLSTGQPVVTRYDFFCTEANGAVTLNGKTFINVYKIRLLPQIRTSAGPLNSTGEIIDAYYAKGVGLIYIKWVNNGYTKIELQIRNWMVY